jgi:hypothetical protein
MTREEIKELQEKLNKSWLAKHMQDVSSELIPHYGCRLFITSYLLLEDIKEAHERGITGDSSLELASHLLAFHLFIAKLLDESGIIEKKPVESKEKPKKKVKPQTTKTAKKNIKRGK